MQVNEWLGNDNQIGIDIWTKKYRYKNENFEEWLDRVSNNSQELRQLIKERKVLFGGRTLSNRNTNKKGSFSNCYSAGYVEDNMNSIMQTAHDLAMTYKAQGGQGISLSKLRPKGTLIGNDYTSDGIVPFMKIFNTVTESVSQGGSRKGALMMSIDIRHKQSDEFITIKSDLDEINKANLSLEIDDKFMNAVQEYYINDNEITLHEVRNYDGHIVEYDIIPIRLYKKMMEMVWDYGEPGCLFTDRLRNFNLMELVDSYEIPTTNPCFTGDMRILTDNGYKTFEELCNNEIQIYNVDGNISNSKIWCSGEKETIKIKLSDKRIITCTPDHRFMTVDGEECQAKDLIGKKIMPLNKINRQFNERYIKYGFIQGDGQLSRLDSDLHKGLEVNIGYKDLDIYELFMNENFTTKSDRVIYLSGFKDDLIALGFSHKNLPERLLPTSYNNWEIDKKRSFLHGCYSANGSVIKNARISYKTTCKEFAKQLSETLLLDFKIDNYITTNKSKLVKFNNGEYNCKESYDINISNYESIQLFTSEINFYQAYKRIKLENLLKNRALTVTSISNNGTHKVYDFTEPHRHWGIVEGFIVHNCGEQPLGKHLSCNLCSLNLSEFVTKPYTNEAYFDLPNFIKATRLMVFEMDKVLDENSNNHALKEQKENSLKYRNIGIGIMGLGSALFKLGITYGSEDSITLIDRIMTSMFRSAVFASADNAVNLGSFPAYEECVYDSEIIQKHFSKDEIDELKSKGLRNCSLLSIAPTGSIGTMLNVTTGIEPSFAIHYTRRTDNLDESYEVYCKEAVEWAEINNITVENLPKYFVCSADINWRDRINIQAVLQEHVDTAISSTVNLPKETTKEEIEQLYLYAWSKGLKGTTIFRDGCKRLGILTANNNETTQENNLEKIESSTLQRGDILCVNDDLLSCKRTVVNGCGKFYIHCDFDEFTGEPLETFIEVGSGGGCERNLQFISRLISLLLRAGVPVEEIIDQALSIRPCKAYTDRTKSKGDTSKGTSCPSAIGYALKELQTKIHSRCFSDDSEIEEIETSVIRDMTEHACNCKDDITNNITTVINACPDCGAELRFEGGCDCCVQCGYSHCG